MELRLTDTEQHTFSLLDDAESQAIFQSRVMYNRLQADDALFEMLQQLFGARTGRSLSELVEEKSGGRPIVLFGAGLQGGSLYRLLTHYCIPVQCFVDNSFARQQIGFCGASVHSPETITEDVFVVLTTNIASFSQQMVAQLIQLGIAPKQIFDPCAVLGTPYFDSELIHFNDHEIFVDAGSFNGDDCMAFVKFCGGQYSRILALEPDPNHYLDVSERLKELERCEVLLLGLWDRSTTLFFAQDEACSHLSSSGETRVHVVSLDRLLEGSPLTFLKMDIEGAEMNALCGAAEIIRTHRPKLAISVYHKTEDITEIPIFLHSLVPSYRFALRHYSLGRTDTVLYAY